MLRVSTGRLCGCCCCCCCSLVFLWTSSCSSCVYLYKSRCVKPRACVFVSARNSKERPRCPLCNVVGWWLLHEAVCLSGVGVRGGGANPQRKTSCKSTPLLDWVGGCGVGVQQNTERWMRCCVCDLPCKRGDTFELMLPLGACVPTRESPAPGASFSTANHTSIHP